MRHHYNGHMILFGILKTKMLLTMQKKTDFFFNHKIWHFLSFLEILIGIWLICLHIVKISDLKIIFMLQGFLIFALHSMRNTQVRKNMKRLLTPYHQSLVFDRYPTTSAKNRISCCSSICRSESVSKERWISFFHPL